MINKKVTRIWVNGTSDGGGWERVEIDIGQRIFFDFVVQKIEVKYTNSGGPEAHVTLSGGKTVVYFNLMSVFYE